MIRPVPNRSQAHRIDNNDHGVQKTGLTPEVSPATSDFKNTIAAQVSAKPSALGAQWSLVPVPITGGILGMAKASASSTPALQGKNLVVQGELAAAFFGLLLNDIDKLVASAKDTPPHLLDIAVQAKLTSHPEPNEKVALDMWSPGAGKIRTLMLNAFDALAEVAPNAVVSDGPRRTVEFAAAQMHAVNAQLNGDVASQRLWGAKMLAASPSDPLASWALKLTELS